MSIEQLNNIALVRDWAGKLAETLGRPAEELRAKGLGAGDFPSGHDLHIRLADGSFVCFRYAFCLVNEKTLRLAVFTEHCGYHLFSAQDAVVTLRYSDRTVQQYAHQDAGA